jgi:hypothetical protein
MDFQLDSYLALKREGYVIPRKHYFFKTITAFEFGQRTVGFIPEAVSAVSEIFDSLIGAGFDCPCNQCIWGRLS